MQVGKINNVMFKSVTMPQNGNNSSIHNKNITELSNITPDFAVKTPQKYTKLGMIKTPEGLEIHSYKLSNGHRVTIIPMENSPATVKNYVNVGSMNETDDIKGISHFLEHMAFNGTNGSDGYVKLERGDSFKKIDSMGGWTNASTNYSLTDYVNSTPLLNEGDLETQIKINAAMMEDLALLPSMIDKEKSPVSSEIDMILDNPGTLAIDQTVRTLFNINSSADELVGGSVEHIKNMTREKVEDYYNKYYTPDNMHLVITGNIDPDETMEIVSKNFVSKKRPLGQRFETKLTPIHNTVRKDYITDKAKSCNIIAGFAGPSSDDIKSVIITEIMSKYIMSQEAGLKKDLKRLNAYGGLGTEKITTNKKDPVFLFYALDCAEKDSEEVLKLVFDKMSVLKAPSEEKLQNIKKHLLTEHYDLMESSAAVNSIAGISLFDGNSDYLTRYDEILNSITVKDIDNYIKKYMDMSKSAITVVHPETTEDEIFNNYKKAQSLSFKGHQRVPVNPEKLEEIELDNNYKLGYTVSKNNNVPFNVHLTYTLPEDINPAAIVVLDAMLSEGTANKTDEEFSKYMDDNNISVYAAVNKTNMEIGGYAEKNQFGTAVNAAKELMYSPRFTEENFNNAVSRLKNSLERTDESAWELFANKEAEVNSLFTSRNQIINGLETLTIDDVKNMYNYIMNNSSGVIVMNVPESSLSIKSDAERMFSEFSEVKPHEYTLKHVYTKNQNTDVITKAKNVSQAEIKQIFKFRTDGSDKEKITGSLLNYILSSSDSVGLFNSLRERDHLAYRVNSGLKHYGDEDILSLTILTSTDNKETGVRTYDNLQKSINGFNRQIGMLLNSEYTDEELETAKRVMKAALLNNESVYSRLDDLDSSLIHNYKTDHCNDLYKMIDSVTRDDIDALAQKIFSEAPIYSIIASQETLDYNKEYLENLKV